MDAQTAERWREFAEAAPELAQHGHRLLYQGADIAAAYLATTAPDGGPRVHPVFPAFALGDLWLFIVNMSPKYRDLVRNGWFALHSMPTEPGGEEFYLRGQAREISDAASKRAVVEATGNRQGGNDFEALFRCELISVLYTQWNDWGGQNPWPNYTKWPASTSGE